ncbi:MAG: hypothetical protein ACPL7K_09490, partial [Armatimonadota bacterium]
QLRARGFQGNRGSAYLVPSRQIDGPVLLSGPEAGVQVNGKPDRLGICVLQDRDELFFTDSRTRIYYTRETPASVTSFPGSDREIRCARCTAPLEPGNPSVRCPGCGLWYHESEELPCWTYAQTCAECGALTSLDGSYTWTPEDL